MDAVLRDGSSYIKLSVADYCDGAESKKVHAYAVDLFALIVSAVGTKVIKKVEVFKLNLVLGNTIGTHKRKMCNHTIEKN